MVLNIVCWLLTFAVVSGREHQPVKDVNGTYLCAIDPPTAVIAAADIVGIPEGVPDVVRCGYACTGFANCTSFNHKSSLLDIKSGGGDSSWGSVCELFTYVPRNCTKSTSFSTNSQCVHYQVAGRMSSCPPVCDPNCVSGCDKQLDGKCDSQCVTGWGLTVTFTCKHCGSNCTSGCLVQGAGKCDSQCNIGFGLSSNYTCRVNLAYNHDAFQYNTYKTANAPFAVDGYYGSQSCTASQGGIFSWWAVDLLQPAVVGTVKVTNDLSSTLDFRLNYFKVGVTNKKPTVGTALNAGTDYTMCAQYCCTVPAGATVEVTCAPNSTPYRYVIIQGTNIGEPICLQEVEVYGV